MVYDFNLLISYSPGFYAMARDEVREVLESLGASHPLISRTLAKGIMGVKTSLDPRQVIQGVRKIFEENPWRLRFTLKWISIDAWTSSDIEAMGGKVKELKDRISKGEKWRMTVEKRRYTKHHKIEIIEAIADLIDEKVDLENPDKILLLEIIGQYAGISILKPEEIFSTTKPYKT